MELLNSSYQLITLLFLLSVFPLLVVMGTCFLKQSVVFSLLRNARGSTGASEYRYLRFSPGIDDIYYGSGRSGCSRLQGEKLSQDFGTFIEQVNSKALDPYRQFILKNTSSEQITFFSDIIKNQWPKKYRDKVPSDSLLILMPAFTVSQVIEAFKIGLLLYLPFVAIDLIVSNILLAMGMMMMSPMTISLPFKILIFILVGGWDMILGQLAGSYK